MRERSPEMCDSPTQTPLRTFHSLSTEVWADPWGVEEIRYGFPGAELDPNDLNRLRQIAAYAAERWKAGDRVLIRCQAGVNRSGLVVGLILREQGMSPLAALAHMRDARSPRVLSNEHFEAGLMDAAGPIPVPRRIDEPSCGVAFASP